MELFFSNLTPWHWLVLAGVLFASESLGAGGFLIGIACSAIIASVLNWLGVGWSLQLVSFGVFSLVLSVAYWKYFKSYNLQRQSGVVVNERMESLKGKTATVLSVASDTQGKVKIGDTLWDYASDERLDENTTVIIDGYNGTTVVVKPV